MKNIIFVFIFILFIVANFLSAQKIASEEEMRQTILRESKIDANAISVMREQDLIRMFNELKTKRTLLDEINDKYEIKQRNNLDKMDLAIKKKHIQWLIKSLSKDLETIGREVGFPRRFMLMSFSSGNNLIEKGYDKLFLSEFYSAKGNYFYIVPNLSVGAITYELSKDGLEINKGVRNNETLRRQLEKEDIDYYIVAGYTYIGSQASLEIKVYDPNEELILEKIYTEKVRQYGLTRVELKNFRLAFGFNTIYARLLGAEYLPPTNSFPVTLNPYLSFGAHVDRYGDFGLKVNMGILKEFDYITMEFYTSVDFGDITGSRTTIFNVLWDINLGIGWQLFNDNFASSYMTFGTGITFVFGEVFTMQAGVNMNLVKERNQERFYFIDNPILPISIYSGIGFYIL